MYPLARRVPDIQELRKEVVGSVFRVHVVKAYGRVEVWYHAFLTLALGWMTDERHASAALPYGEEPRVLCVISGFRRSLNAIFALLGY